MNKKIIEIIMNPVRQRILQFLLLHGTGTAGSIRNELSDIPPASLYRHLNLLLEAGLIEVASETRIRGTAEKTYRLVQNPIGRPDREEYQYIFRTMMLSLMTSFHHYFQQEQADPEKDMLNLTSSTLLLTDEEFVTLLQKIDGIMKEAAANPPGHGRKPRRISLISSPCEEESSRF